MKDYLKASILLFVFAFINSTKDVKAQKTPESLGWQLVHKPIPSGCLHWKKL